MAQIKGIDKGLGKRREGVKDAKIKKQGIEE
jgi:hypothetical protein